MKNRILLISLLFVFYNFNAQVGINTVSPATTLEITAKNSTGTSATTEGLLIPRVDRQRAQSMTAIPVSTLIYVNDFSSGTPTGNAVNIDNNGYYYYDGTVWMKLNTNIYNSNGTLTENRVVTQNGNTLAFEGTSVNAFSVDGTTLSVDAASNRVGVGTNAPAQGLDIEGTARLSQSVAANTPIRLPGTTKPLYVNSTDGTVTHAPIGFTRVSGGFRPSIPFTIATLPVTNTIVRVRFVCHVDQSDETNNSDTANYAYGDFTIVGTGTADPIQFRDVNIKNFDGTAKTLITNTPTTITWSNGSTISGNPTITLNQTTGEFRMNAGTVALSYFFEMLGGS